jgi:hypothetical protein
MILKVTRWVIPALFFIACNDQLSKEEKAFVATADSTGLPAEYATEATVARKIIRTADIRCRVQDVFRSATEVEHMVNAAGGSVAESRYVNEIADTKEFNISADSLKQVQVYTPTANLTLRIPTKYLDSVVAALSGSAAFINQRTLKQTDATYEYLSNALRNEALTPAAQVPQAITNRQLPVKQYSDEQQSDAIDRRMENLRVLDDVNYATCTVQLFQPQRIDVTIIADPAMATQAGWNSEIGSSLRNGVSMLRGILMFLISIWPAWVIGGLVYLVYRHAGSNLPSKTVILKTKTS